MNAVLMLVASKVLATFKSSAPATSGSTLENAPEDSGEVRP
jgi:hypothetical protein